MWRAGTKTTPIEMLQTKAQAPSQTLNKKVIIATKGEQHIKTDLGYTYEIKVKDGEVLSADFDLIAKKAGSDLEVLLENDAIVIFDDYFKVCATDLSCMVSLPSEDGMYHVVKGNFVPLADGSQIVHFYGDEEILSRIANSQSSLFAQSFSDVFLSLDNTNVLAGLAIAGLAGAGGGSGGSGGSAADDGSGDGAAGGSGGSGAVNDAPTRVNPIADQFIDENDPFSLEIAANTFSDADNDPLTYTATLANGNSLPAWLSFDSSTRTFSGVPLDADVGVINVRITASDVSSSVTDTFSITVGDVNNAPALDNLIDDQFIDENDPFSLEIAANTFSDADNDPLTYTATLANGNSLPAWLSFDATTGTFSGTPLNGDVGVISVSVTASDGEFSVFDGFSITVIDATAPRIVNITSSTKDGCFGLRMNDSIELSVHVDSEMRPDSKLSITLNNNQVVHLTRHTTDANIYTGTYFIQKW